MTYNVSKLYHWEVVCDAFVEVKDGEEQGITNYAISGDFLHTGQVAFNLSHSSTQSTWK